MEIPVNPEITDPVENIDSADPPPDKVSVPVPESVLLVTVTLVVVGLLPSGNVQLLWRALMFDPVALIMTLLKVTLLQFKLPAPPSKVIVPPLALKVGELVIVRLPATVIVPVGAVNDPPEMANAPLISAPDGRRSEPEERVSVDADEKELSPLRLIVPPATVKIFRLIPEKPEKPEPAFMVIVPADLVRVPLPLRVPFTVRFPALVIVGLLPSGSVQLLLIVFVLVLVKVMRLNVTLLQLSVPVPSSKVMFPPLALKVGDPEIVRAPPRKIVPELAVNDPPLKVNVVSTSRV